MPPPDPILAGPPPRVGKISLLKQMRIARDNGIAAIPQEAFEKPILEGRIVWLRSCLVNDPDGIRHVLRDNAANYGKSDLIRRLLEPALGKGLLTSEGELWRTHRRIMAPSFDHRNFSRYAPIMTERAEAQAREWRELPAGAVVDVSAAMMKTTAGIIARSMFSTDAGEMVELLESGMEQYQETALPNLLDILGMPAWLAGFRRARTTRRLLKPLDAAIERLVASRRQSGPDDGRDLLSGLLAARDPETGLGLPGSAIRDQLVTIFLAGHETTSLALTWTWYLLALHPRVEETLHAELAQVLGGRTPCFEDVPKLLYTRMVIEEAMRLYPPVFSLSSRQAKAPDVICGHKVAAGSYVLIVPWILHRHRLLWENPDRFDPERFSPENSEKRSRYAYLPFSAGQRVCIGAGFAMTEAILILASLAREFSPRLAPGHLVEPRGLITLRARHGMKMTVNPARRSG